MSMIFYKQKIFWFASIRDILGGICFFSGVLLIVILFFTKF
ncbi:hypothetical protein DCCM_2272 [Desulfocucumis palustris]|uniref:Uncharacterized protein n=1 Tax=Desulfocucumis palustris TaxID=1898651 RepID=A0A2L2XAF2_9FIRM|nr:hypothetical protein DCCM_2272 [Desulfocucumis palustris]